MFQPLKRTLQRWREAQAADALSDRELDDLGLTRSQMKHFLTMPADVPDRVLAMGQVFGLSEGAIKRDHTAWTDMVETCALCKDRAACALVLSKGELANPRDAGFCPNHAFFEAHWKLA